MNPSDSTDEMPSVKSHQQNVWSGHPPDSIWCNILREVATVLEIPVEDLDPLSEYINPEALVRFFNFHDTVKARSEDTQITFQYMDLQITLFETGDVRILEE